MAKRDRRADIMRAAESLFTSRRFHEITLDDVVQEAHVGKGTIYRYFRDKDDLFFQTATSGFDELCGLVAQAAGDGGGFQQQLLATVRRISEFFGKRRQLFRMMQSEEARAHWFRGDARQSWRQQRRKLISAVGQVIQAGVAEGRIRPDVPAEVLATFLLGMLRTRARDLADEVAPAHRSLELVVELFIRGAGPAEPPAAVSAASAESLQNARP